MISGAAVSVQQIAESMAQLGHQVLVIAASDRDYPYNLTRDNLTILRLRSLSNPLRVGQRAIANPRRVTMNALARFQPDVIHVHELMQLGTLALAYAKREQVPVIFTVHLLPGFATTYLPGKLGQWTEQIIWIYARAILGKYSAVITPTKTTADTVRERTGIKSKVISNGLNLMKFHLPLPSDDEAASRQKWNLPLRVPLLLHVGRLDADKRVDKVIRAIAQTLRESETHLVIVGDGCQKNTLMQLCVELGISERVHFMGFVSVEVGLPDLYRLANIFVMTSEIESQGLVLLEAAASGLPIVAVDATCISEIVRDRVNGFLVKPGDIEAFQAATVQLLNNPKKARRMGREGRILAQEHDLQYTWHQHEELYLETIKRTRHSLIKTGRSYIQSKLMKTLISMK
jgi:glycosyltransferase involved in cell wall biosynthesis